MRARRPDPVLQQIEDFGDGTVSANDCFRPVSRYLRPHHAARAAARRAAAAHGVLTDPARVRPVTLAFCQDVQAEAFDYPEAFFARRVWRLRRPPPDARELDDLVAALRAARTADRGRRRRALRRRRGALARCASARRAGGRDAGGKGASPGTIPATGQHRRHRHRAPPTRPPEADLVLGVGTRLQDFTTGSRALFANPAASSSGERRRLRRRQARRATVVGDRRLRAGGAGGAHAGWRAPAAWPAAQRLKAWTRGRRGHARPATSAARPTRR
jgi:3D-(3,5/4)-trihydroxycyclohexane-1,2-dione acylhydrolase (decyclizing)